MGGGLADQSEHDPFGQREFRRRHEPNLADASN